MRRLLRRGGDALDLIDRIVQALIAGLRDFGCLTAALGRALRAFIDILYVAGKGSHGLRRIVHGLQLLRRAGGHMRDGLGNLVRCLGRLLGRGIHLLDRCGQVRGRVADGREHLCDVAAHGVERLCETPELVIRRRGRLALAEVTTSQLADIAHHALERPRDAADRHDDAEGYEYEQDERYAGHDLQCVIRRGKQLILIGDGGYAPARPPDRIVDGNHFLAIGSREALHVGPA